MKVRWHCLVIGLIVVLGFPGSVFAASKPLALADLAFYKGADRQQVLEEGAKREGKLTFYTSASFSTIVGPVIEAFNKKYPYIKVDMWRGTSPQVASRTLEEFNAGRNMVDVIEGTQTAMIVLLRTNIVQPFLSPSLDSLEDEAKTMAPGGGVSAVAYRASGIGFGYNTKMVSEDQLPKTYHDLLNPKWKGKLAIAGSNTGVGWMGAVHKHYGEDLVRKIAAQKYAVQMISANSLIQLVAAGEYAASPTLIDANVAVAKMKGAPVDWEPLEPVRVNVGQIAVARKAPNPFAALLFAEFEISREVSETLRKRSYGSFRKDVAPLAKNYKKYFGPETAEGTLEQEALFKKLFLLK